MKKLLNIMLLGMIFLSSCSKENLKESKIYGNYRCEYYDYHEGESASSVIRLAEDGNFTLQSSTGILFSGTYDYDRENSNIYFDQSIIVDTARAIMPGFNLVPIAKIKGNIQFTLISGTSTYSDLTYIKYE